MKLRLKQEKLKEITRFLSDKQKEPELLCFKPVLVSRLFEVDVKDVYQA